MLNGKPSVYVFTQTVVAKYLSLHEKTVGEWFSSVLESSENLDDDRGTNMAGSKECALCLRWLLIGCHSPVWSTTLGAQMPRENKQATTHISSY